MSERIEVTKGDMVEALVKSMLDDLEMNPDYLEVICRRGFMGYEEYTTEDLLHEYREYISEDPDYDVVITVKEGNEDE
jgi:hypothetical protein